MKTKLIINMLAGAMLYVLGAHQVFGLDPDTSSQGATASRTPPKSASLDLNVLLRDIQKTEQKVQANLQCGREDSTRILVLGKTGSGKSTLVHGLSGKRLEGRSVKKGRRTLDVGESELEGFTIGHGLGSETQIPNIWFDERTNLIYCDCPGFMDSRGVGQEIVNAFAIDQLFTAPSRIKILLALQESDFEGARGMAAIEEFNKLQTLVPDLDQLKQALLLVVTKSSGEFRPQDKVEGLLSDAREEQAERIRTRRETDGLDAPIELLSFLMRNPHQIFSFPSPKFDGLYALFQDRERIIGRLGLNPIIDSRHNISFEFNTEVVFHIYEMVRKSGNMGNFIPELVSMMQDNYRGKDLKILREWEKFNSQLLTNILALDTPDKFVVRFKELLPSSSRDLELFNELTNKIRSCQRYIDFVNRVKAVRLEEADIRSLIKPPLESMRSELQGLVESKEFLVKQEEATRVLKIELNKAVLAGKIAKEEADIRIREVEEKSRQDNLRIEKEFKTLQAESVAVERDLKSKLKEQEDQHNKAISDLKKTIEEQQKAAATEAAAEQRRLLDSMRRLQLDSMSPGCMPYNSMSSMGGFSSPSMLSMSDFPMMATPSGKQNRIWIQPYTRKTGVQVKGYWRKK